MSETKGPNVECGDYKEPPSRAKITVWCIVELILMAVIGLNCLYGFFEAFDMQFIQSIIFLVGNGFGIAGLGFVIFGLWKENGAFMKTGTFCFAIALIISIVIFIWRLFFDNSKLTGSSIVHLVLDCFLCYLFWVQSGGFQ